MRKWIFPILLVAAWVTLAHADPTTQPALPAKSTTDDILDALDARGTNLQDFSAGVTLTDTDASTGDATINTGTGLKYR